MIPGASGGNKLRGSGRYLGVDHSFSSDNITDELRPFISEGNRLDYNYDVNSVFGGPLKRDKLWFLLAQRFSRTNNLIPLPTYAFPQGGSAESGGQMAPLGTLASGARGAP